MAVVLHPLHSLSASGCVGPVQYRQGRVSRTQFGGRDLYGRAVVSRRSVPRRNSSLSKSRVRDAFRFASRLALAVIRDHLIDEDFSDPAGSSLRLRWVANDSTYGLQPRSAWRESVNERLPFNDDFDILRSFSVPTRSIPTSATSYYTWLVRIFLGRNFARLAISSAYFRTQTEAVKDRWLPQPGSHIDALGSFPLDVVNYTADKRFALWHVASQTRFQNFSSQFPHPAFDPTNLIPGPDLSPYPPARGISRSRDYFADGKFFRGSRLVPRRPSA